MRRRLHTLLSAAAAVRGASGGEDVCFKFSLRSAFTFPGGLFLHTPEAFGGGRSEGESAAVASGFRPGEETSGNAQL
ncbi:MAG TPA: hypothetical protein VF527_08375 [Pyrinomonadaceae bacterium]|jgi:hypothetical protein